MRIRESIQAGGRGLDEFLKPQLWMLGAFLPEDTLGLIWKDAVLTSLAIEIFL